MQDHIEALRVENAQLAAQIKLQTEHVQSNTQRRDAAIVEALNIINALQSAVNRLQGILHRHVRQDPNVATAMPFISETEGNGDQAPVIDDRHYQTPGSHGRYSHHRAKSPQSAARSRQPPFPGSSSFSAKMTPDPPIGEHGTGQPAVIKASSPTDKEPSSLHRNISSEPPPLSSLALLPPPLDSHHSAMILNGKASEKYANSPEPSWESRSALESSQQGCGINNYPEEQNLTHQLAKPHCMHTYSSCVAHCRHQCAQDHRYKIGEVWCSPPDLLASSIRLLQSLGLTPPTYAVASAATGLPESDSN